jgi:hypothetical protein
MDPSLFQFSVNGAMGGGDSVGLSGAVLASRTGRQSERGCARETATSSSDHRGLLRRLDLRIRALVGFCIGALEKSKLRIRTIGAEGNALNSWRKSFRNGR